MMFILNHKFCACFIQLFILLNWVFEWRIFSGVEPCFVLSDCVISPSLYLSLSQICYLIMKTMCSKSSLI